VGVRERVGVGRAQRREVLVRHRLGDLLAEGLDLLDDGLGLGRVGLARRMGEGRGGGEQRQSREE
jgi:hypothetical protein